MRGPGTAALAPPLVALLVALLLALVACAPAQVGVELGSPAAPPAAPAAPPGGEAPELGGLTLEAAAIPAIHEGRLSGVAASPAGVVAVGTGGAGEPLILFSPDGRAWSRVGAVAGFELVDVAAGPGGFVAVGSTGGDAPVRAVFLVSADGRSWERLGEAAHDGLHAWMSWVAAGPSGYRAGGYPDGTGPVSWTSADGRAWRLDGEGIRGAAASGDGWLELGDRRVRVVPAGVDADADVDWALLEEPAGDDTILDVRTGGVATGGMVVMGTVGKPCGPGASCAAESGEWASTDGVTWRLVPVGDPGRPAEFIEQLVAAPGGALLATTYAAVLATPDGWHWTTAVQSEEIGLTVVDAAATGDGIVVVGEDTRTGSAVPGIGIALP
ncbi:MAG TPA: hypothetical protein VFY23_00490 [Candidatus Limnocylindrales bacterium]|nr:hypothetical protein [Candidatus Limnocylindrales bacterium]